MSENCNPNDRLLESRVAALEKLNDQHGNTHREIFGRLNAIERENAVQNAQYDAIIDKLDALTAKHDRLNAKLEELEAKPGKRFDTIVMAAVSAVVGAVVGFFLSGGAIG